MRRIALGMAAALLFGAGPASAQVVGLGLTHHQLEDADLVDAAGRDIGDVEHVVMGPGGKAEALIISVDRPDPQRDKLVRIGLAGLKARPEKGDPGDYVIVTPISAARLLAMPDWQPR